MIVDYARSQVFSEAMRVLSFRSVDIVLRLEILVAVEEKTRCVFQMTRISDSA